MSKFHKDMVGKVLELLDFVRTEELNHLSSQNTIIYTKQGLKIRIGGQNLSINEETDSKEFVHIIPITEFLSLVTNVPLLYDLLRSYTSSSSKTRNEELKVAYEKGFKDGKESQ